MNARPSPRRPAPARVTSEARPFRGLQDALPGAGLDDAPFSDLEWAILRARAHHVALGEEPMLIPWHDPALDARALAESRRLQVLATPAAALLAAELLELVHAAVAARDAEAGADLAHALALRQTAAAAGMPPPTAQLRAGMLLWSGRRVRLAFDDVLETLNPLWVDVDTEPHRGLVGRYEAAAAAALRLQVAGPTLLLLPGVGALHEAQAWLQRAGVVDGPGLGLVAEDPLLAMADALPTSLVLATPPDAEFVLGGPLTRALWLMRQSQPGDRWREVRLLVGVDLRPDAVLVARELRRAEHVLKSSRGATPAEGSEPEG